MNLVYQKNEILLLEKRVDFHLIFAFNIVTLLTLMQSNIQELSLSCIIVSINTHEFLIYAPKLFLISDQVWNRLIVYGKKLVVAARDPQFLFRTLMCWDFIKTMIHFIVFVHAPVIRCENNAAIAGI